MGGVGVGCESDLTATPVGKSRGVGGWRKFKVKSLLFMHPLVVFILKFGLVYLKSN
jgi:hypothetical protein